MKKRVLLGMSGGIDSTVSALLLKQQGFEVLGITFNLFPSTNAEKQRKDVTALCDNLGIEHYFFDLQKEFRTEIIDYYTSEYLDGRTPFPCVVCNVKIKWKYLNEQARLKNCDFIATGHYVQKKNVEKKYFIQKGIDLDKDQSFFLWNLSQEIIGKCVFPLGSLFKKEVRQIASKNGFEVLSEKKESMGACFIENSDYRIFLQKEMEAKGIEVGPGKFVNTNGEIIGFHKGYPFYTIGQRRGLNLNTNGSNYVLKIDADTNKIVIGAKKELYKKQIKLTDYILNDQKYLDEEKEIIVKIRYRKQSNLAVLKKISNELILVDLKVELDSIASGQTAVFYDGDLVIGGGFIS